jgi:hypothetical protein
MGNTLWYSREGGTNSECQMEISDTGSINTNTKPDLNWVIQCIVLHEVNMYAGLLLADLHIRTHSFSPSIYAQGECFLMRRNCNCNY